MSSEAAEKAEAGLREEIGRLRTALRLMGVAPRAFLVPSSLGVLDTALRLVTFSLFLPLIHALVSGDPQRLDRWLPASAWVPQDGPVPAVWFFAAAIAVAAFARAACAWAAVRTLARRTGAAEARLGERILRSYLSFGQQHYDRTRLGANARQIQRLPTRAARLLPFLERSFRSFVSLGLYFAAMAWLSWPLALGALVFLSAYLLIFQRFANQLESVAERLDQAEEAVSAATHELLMNLPLVRLAGLAEREVGGFLRAAQAESQAREAEEGIRGLVEPAREAFNVIVVLLFVGGASVLLRDLGAAAVSRYVIFFLIFRRAMSSFGQLQRIPAEWEHRREDLTRLFSTLDERGKFVVPEGSREFERLGSGIEACDLTFAYADKAPVLRNVSLRIPSGERTTIVGATGSGKSTFLQLVLRVYDCPPGSIRLDGIDIRELRTGSLLARVAYASSESLFFHDTIRRNVTYGLGQVDEGRLREAAARAQALTLIDSLERGFDEVVGDQGTRLSTGERQRLSLIRVFLRDPEVILFDEASSALDAATEARVLEELDKFAVGRTLVVVAHRLSGLGSDDHVVVFQEGRVEEQGRRDALLAVDGEFARLWRAQRLPSARPGSAGARLGA